MLATVWVSNKFLHQEVQFIQLITRANLGSLHVHTSCCGNSPVQPEAHDQ